MFFERNDLITGAYTDITTIVIGVLLAIVIYYYWGD